MGTTLKYSRRISHEVAFGGVTIGGKQPIAVQSMANTPTADVERSVEQTIRIADAGAEIVRLTAQGRKEGEALTPIMEQLRTKGCCAAIVADIHFTPEIAMMAAEVVDKVRINPGNFRTSNGELQSLIDICKRRWQSVSSTSGVTPPRVWWPRRWSSCICVVLRSSTMWWCR